MGKTGRPGAGAAGRGLHSQGGSAAVDAELSEMGSGLGIKQFDPMMSNL